MVAKHNSNDAPEPSSPRESHTGQQSHGGQVEPLADPDETEDHPPTPKSLTFRYLAILWCLPSFGAIWILVAEMGDVLSQPASTQKLGAISVEQWVSVVLLLLHITFVGLAIHFRRAESQAPGSGS